MAAPDNPPHALHVSRAMNGLGMDDPAAAEPHQVRASPESPPTPTDDRGDDDDNGENDRDHTFEEAVDRLVTQWHICIDELRQLQEATPASPIYGLSNLLKAQQQSLDKSLQRKIGRAHV